MFNSLASRQQKNMLWRGFLFAGLTAVTLAGCGGGGGGTSEVGTTTDVSDQGIPCEGQCADASSFLTVSDVQQVIAQAVAEAKAQNSAATIAVTDRVGNVLAVYRTADVDTSASVLISTTVPVEVTTGLEGIALPNAVGGDALAAIAKAITGAYLGTEGNAFSTRTASQIIQENFNPGEGNQPAGPLFGVQFSQLACSDFINKNTGSAATIGPQRSPLGLSADPGGFPLYKNGAAVGGVGVMADNLYTIDKSILDVDRDLDEMIALAGTFNFASPLDRRADRITADGKNFRYSDVEFDDLVANPDNAAAFSALTASDGFLIPVPDYTQGAIIRGTAFGQPESGVRSDTADYPGLDAYVFVDEANQNRFPPSAGLDGGVLSIDPLQPNEVREVLRAALDVANRARAQIRRPIGTPARVTISVVDTLGNPLGIARTLDAPIFGADVSLQKARTAAFFSGTDAGDYLNSITTPTTYFQGDPIASLIPKENVQIGDYVTAVRDFVGPTALQDGIAFSDRAGGNLSRPNYPDGLQGRPHGPLSKSDADNEWSVFSTGLQLDLVFNKTIQHIGYLAGLNIPGTSTPIPEVGPSCISNSPGPNDADRARLANGTQIFPGSVPIYRGSQLVGAIGVSGDGVDQDDMISFLGVHNAGLTLNGSINNAPADIRADNIVVQGVRLRYISCPQTPFIDSDEQNVCSDK